MWYIIRARSFWFFTASNPNIAFGGYEGEAKTDVYPFIPEGYYPLTVLVKARENFDDVKKRIADSGLEYPFIVKPDVGRNGLLFRKIDNDEQLLEYHNYCPINYMAQTLLDMPVE